MNDNDVIQWLSEDNNPAVKYRTQTEILKQSADRTIASRFIYDKIPSDWYDVKGLWYIYYITALAESGLRTEDVMPSQIQRAFDIAEGEFDGGCAAFVYELRIN